MFARIDGFRGSPNRVADGSRAVDEVALEMQQLPGFQYSYLLVDGTTGKALAITLWDDEDAARRGPGTSVRDRTMRALGALDTPSVETYEVGLETTGGTTGGQFARVSEYHGHPSRIDDGIRHAKDTEPDLKALNGFQHGYVLVDRKSGKMITLGIWDSAEARTRVSPRADSLRRRIARSLGASGMPTAESFEIAGTISHRARRAA